MEGVLEGNSNILFSAPTSAGKSLVAELIMLSAMRRAKKKALFVLPFVSIASEKVLFSPDTESSSKPPQTEYFSSLVEALDVKVGGFFGTSRNSLLEKVDIGKSHS